MGYLITDIIQWAEISQPFARYDQERKLETKGASTIQDLDIKLYVERKSLQYAYDQDPTSDETFQIGQWVLSLIGIYLFKAQQVTGSGGSIAPITPSGGLFFDYLIPVLGGVPDFANATDYNDSRIVGKNLEIFWNDIPRFLVAGEWAYTPTGIRILVGGFDATANTYDFKIFIRNPFGASGTGVEVTRSFQYTGIGGETSFFEPLLADSTIISVARGTDYELINSGTPTGLQALITLSGSLSDGHITFAADNPMVAGEIVTVIFSKAV